MRVEITLDILVGSIVNQLKDTFGEDYKYYDKVITQGFEKPSFSVTMINNISTRQYAGNELTLMSDSYRFGIYYFYSDKYPNKKEVWDVMDKLKLNFQFLTIVNFLDNDEIRKEQIKVSNLVFQEVDTGVLLCQIELPVKTVILNEVTKVNSLKNDIINKESRGN